MPHNEINRRFLIEKMPILFWRRPVKYERYFIQHGDLVEERIQKYGNVYEYEIKTAVSPREWKRDINFITKHEFDKLKTNHRSIVRYTYILGKKKPGVSIHKYAGDYSGLIFAEVGFSDIEEVGKYSPPSWMGTEITECPLGRDSWLLDLDREHFLRALDTEMENLNIGTKSFS